MRALTYDLTKTTGDGKTLNVSLNQDDIRQIWALYDCFLTEERVWNKLRYDYGLTNYEMHEQLVCNIAYSYGKNLDFGCDETYSITEALEEYSAQIEEAVANVPPKCATKSGAKPATR